MIVSAKFLTTGLIVIGLYTEQPLAVLGLLKLGWGSPATEVYAAFHDKGASNMSKAMSYPADERYSILPGSSLTYRFQSCDFRVEALGTGGRLSELVLRTHGVQTGVCQRLIMTRAKTMVPSITCNTIRGSNLIMCQGKTKNLYIETLSREAEPRSLTVDLRDGESSVRSFR